MPYCRGLVPSQSGDSKGAVYRCIMGGVQRRHPTEVSGFVELITMQVGYRGTSSGTENC